MAFVDYTDVLQDAGIPKDIADNIVDAKEYLDRIEETKRAIRELRGIYKAYKNFGSSWCLNVFWELKPGVDVLLSNTDKIHEAWFKEHWTFLFRDLLREIRYNFDEYVRSRRHRVGGMDEFALSQMNEIQKYLLDPLMNMRQNVDIRLRSSWQW